MDEQFNETKKFYNYDFEESKHGKILIVVPPY
jgi:hypothetical protein